MFKNDRTYYKRNILVSVIISEILVISAFVLFPGEKLQHREILVSDPVIKFDEIPQTIQSSAKPALPPDTPPINIIEEIDAFETLDNVTIMQGNEEQPGESFTENKDVNNIKYVRSAPRLLYEVVPADVKDELHGRLQISLKINQDGRVTGHRILYNSLDCSECLNDLINAAYKSKWEPAAVNGRNESYWVVKSYSFN